MNGEAALFADIPSTHLRLPVLTLPSLKVGAGKSGVAWVRTPCTFLFCFRAKFAVSEINTALTT